MYLTIAYFNIMINIQIAKFLIRNHHVSGVNTNVKLQLPQMYHITKNKCFRSSFQLKNSCVIIASM